MVACWGLRTLLSFDMNIFVYDAYLYPTQSYFRSFVTNYQNAKTIMKSCIVLLICHIPIAQTYYQIAETHNRWDTKHVLISSWRYQNKLPTKLKQCHDNHARYHTHAHFHTTWFHRKYKNSWVMTRTKFCNLCS